MTQYTKVWQLLEDPGRWTQRENARDASGKSVPATNPKACRWCLNGAILKIYPLSDGYSSVFQLVYKRLSKQCIGSWNDKPLRTHDEVLSLCRELDI